MDEFRIRQDIAVLQREVLARLEKIDIALHELRRGVNSLDGVRLLDRWETCQYLNVGIRQLSRMRAAGQIEAIKIGRRTFYKITEIENFIRRNYGTKKVSTH